jgi:hypothetical protein
MSVMLLAIHQTASIELDVFNIYLLSLAQVYGQENEDTERQDKALFYLQTVSIEDLDWLYQYCQTHSSLGGNVFVPLPDYVTCDDVNFEKLNRGMDKMLTGLENMVSGNDQNMTQEKLQVLKDLGFKDEIVKKYEDQMKTSDDK